MVYVPKPRCLYKTQTWITESHSPMPCASTNTLQSVPHACSIPKAQTHSTKYSILSIENPAPKSNDRMGLHCFKNVLATLISLEKIQPHCIAYYTRCCGSWKICTCTMYRAETRTRCSFFVRMRYLMSLGGIIIILNTDSHSQTRLDIRRWIATWVASLGLDFNVHAWQIPVTTGLVKRRLVKFFCDNPTDVNIYLEYM